jgi:hypothetical protein
VEDQKLRDHRPRLHHNAAAFAQEDRSDSMACLMATLFSRSFSAKYFFATSHAESPNARALFGTNATGFGVRALFPGLFTHLLLLATNPGFGSNTDRHGAVNSHFFILKQRSTFDASKIELAQSLRASGVHAALCSAVPRFSPAKAIVELDATAIVGTRARNS